MEDILDLAAVLGPLPKKIALGRGRVFGRQEFTNDDKRRAFEVIRRVKPLIDQGTGRWNIVARTYNFLAGRIKPNERKDRSGAFLESYYKHMVQEGREKPSSADLSWDARLANEIEREIRDWGQWTSWDM